MSPIDAMTGTEFTTGVRWPRPIAPGAALGATGDAELLAAVSVVLLSFVVPQVSVLAAMVLSLVLVWQAIPEKLPAIFVCQLSASDFRIANMGSMDYWVSRFEDMTVNVGGFPVTPNYILLAGTALRVIYELFTNARSLSRGTSLFLVVFWIVTLFPALIATFSALASRTRGWTGPIRLALLTGGYFYGAIIWKRRSAATQAILLSRFLSVFTVMFGLAAIDLCFQRTLFVFVAFVPPMSLLAVVRGRGWVRVLGCAAFAVTATYALGLLGLSSVKARVHGGVATTTTLAIEFLSAFGLTAMAHWRPTRPSRGRAIGAGLFLGAVVIAVPFIVATIHLDRFGGANWGDETLTFAQRVYFKLFDERGPLWQGALEDIMLPPYFIRVFNRPFFAYRPGIGLGQVPFGSHNTVLEELRVNGFLVGSFALFMLIVILINCFLALGFESDDLLRAFAVALIVCGTVAVTASSFMTEVNCGFWFFAPAGMIAASLRERSARNAISRPEARQIGSVVRSGEEVNAVVSCEGTFRLQ